MQFALPPRRSPHTLPGAHSSRLPLYRRKQLKTIAIFAFAVLTLLYLISRLFSSSSTSLAAPAGTAGVVIVTLLDRQSLSESYINKIVTNREDYAKRHGKHGFYPICSSFNWSCLGLSLIYLVKQGTRTSSQASPITRKL